MAENGWNGPVPQPVHPSPQADPRVSEAQMDQAS